MLGPDLRIRRFTPMAEKTFNLIRTDVGRPISDIKLNIDVPDLEQLVVQVIDTVSAKEQEVQDKQGRWYSLRIRPYRTLENKIDGAVLVLVDVDNLKRAEEARSALEARNAAILQTALDAVITIDHEGKVVEFNSAAERIFGYPRDEAIGKEMAELIMPTSLRERHRQGLAHYLATGEAPLLGKLIEMPGLRADGTEFPAELSITAIPTGGPPMFTGYLRDITERKQAEERFRQVVEAAPNAMIMVGKGGKISLVNQQVEALFGYAREELLGQPIEMLVPKRFRAKHPVYRDSFFADPKARPMGAGRDLFGLRKDGSEFPVEISLNPIQTPEGLFTLASIIDITERKRLLEDLHKRVGELADADRIKNEFLAMLGHELRGPLAPIRNGLHILREPNVDGSTIERVKSIMDQ